MKNVISNIYNQGYLEYLKDISDNFFDLAIVDPICNLDDSMIFDLNLNELKRTCKDIIIWHINQINFQQNINSGRIIWDKINYDKNNCEPVIAYNSCNKNIEIVRCLWNNTQQGLYCTNDLGKATILKREKQKEEIYIANQKPIALYAYILNKYAKKKANIFDAYMNVQTLRIAAYKLKINYYGCEEDKYLYELGNKRFYKECMGLFTATNGKRYKELSIF